MNRAHNVDFCACVESEVLRDSRNFIRREHDTKPEDNIFLPCQKPQKQERHLKKRRQAERDHLLAPRHKSVRVAFRNREHIQTSDRDLRNQNSAALDVIKENFHDTVAERDHEEQIQQIRRLLEQRQRVRGNLNDVPADRLSPRLRLKNSLDQIFAEKLPGVIDSVESKVFGIGLEAYTVGSNEFYTAYAARQPGVYNLLDNGHYHPQEFVSDKIPAMLCYFDKLPLHITRPMRWDSDHVVRFEDEIREIATEIVRCNATERVLIGLDFFDASINRVAAWVIGARNVEKALLWALLMPHDRLRTLQDEDRFTELLMAQEELKTLPFGAVWEEYCRQCGVPENEGWFQTVEKYEADVLKGRN